MKKILILLVIILAFAFYWTQLRGDISTVDVGTEYQVKIDGYKDQIKDGLSKIETEVFNG